MGSVPHLYTTGDNDPELEPVQYYRHYLYCDACGSFELDPWLAADNPRAIEKRRHRLAVAATFSLPLVLIPVWELLGLFSLFFLTLAIAGFLGNALYRGYMSDWSLLRDVLLWLPFVAVAELITLVVFPPQVVLVAGAVVILALLAVRSRLAAGLESRGLSCRRCGATYAYGSPLFTDLDANPRGLELDQVPRPLGVTPFETGKHVGPAPAHSVSQLPR